jgi:hypothetical protein
VILGQSQTEFEGIYAPVMGKFVKKTFVGYASVGVPHRAPFLRHIAYPRCIVALNTVMGDLVGGTIGEDAEGLL